MTDKTVITMGPNNPVPIEDLIEVGLEYSCSRQLFSFVNRNLNAIGLRADVRVMGEGSISFLVERLHKQAPQRMRVTNVACCDECWHELYGDYPPVRLKEPLPEICFWCAKPTKSGIYRRTETEIIDEDDDAQGRTDPSLDEASR